MISRCGPEVQHERTASPDPALVPRQRILGLALPSGNVTFGPPFVELGRARDLQVGAVVHDKHGRVVHRQRLGAADNNGVAVPGRELQVVVLAVVSQRPDKVGGTQMRHDAR